MEIRKLPIGIQSFEKLREDGYLYVDKTEYIKKLVSTGKVYFLSRPRRFGKSLFLTTLEAYFQGKKELFAGLAIEQYENAKGPDAWQSYPVIRFSLAGGTFVAEDGLSKRLGNILSDYENQYHVVPETDDLPSRFTNLIHTMNRMSGKQVVVLVDEYDETLPDAMKVDKDQLEKDWQLYNSFFGVLKDEDEYIEFIFFAGVTKFARASISSGMNQLRDISMSDEYAGICGITEDELTNIFMPEIQAMAEKKKCDVNKIRNKLADMYGGYSFSLEGVHVYNSFSLLNAFQERNFGKYWFSTGTPTFLVHALDQADYTPEKITDGVEVTEDILRDYRGDWNDPVQLAYQAGYLTIRNYDEENDLYELGFPNDEVEYGYLNVLAPSVLGGRETDRVDSM